MLTRVAGMLFDNQLTSAAVRSVRGLTCSYLRLRCCWQNLINSFANLIKSAGAGAKVFHLLARSPHALTGREAQLGRGEVGEDKR